MNKTQLDFLQLLKGWENDGTLMSVLLSDKLNEVPFENVAKFLIQRLYNEKHMLLKENQKYIKCLMENNLYTSELMEK